MGVTYLMTALQKDEVERYCVDSKQTFFRCSFDGASAFEVVNREILLKNYIVPVREVNSGLLASTLTQTQKQRSK